VPSGLESPAFLPDIGPFVFFGSCAVIKMDICDCRLTWEYNAATETFSWTAAEMLGKMGVSPKEEYERLQRVSEA
jgi:hypothetical protein